MAVTVEICICGHPVARHDLPGTDYSHCMNWSSNGKCYCTGGIRPAIWAVEKEENPNMTATVARFFKRQFRTDNPGAHPLNGGIARAREEGYEIEWAVDNCDRCGDERYGDLIAWNVDSEDKPQRQFREITGRSILICTNCDLEDSYLQSEESRVSSI